MIYIGVDPGLTGYIVALKGPQEVVLAEPFPCVQSNRGRTLNVPALVVIFEKLGKHGSQVMAAVERVGPTMGAKAMFHFGGTYFSTQTALSCFGIPYVLVEPKVWMKHYGLLKSPKDKSRLVAGQLFPGVELHLKKHTDKAEAILIARYMADINNSANRKRLTRRPT